MNPLYSDAIEVADRLKEARLNVVRISSDVVQAEYDVTLAQARVERGLVKKVGDEKKLGLTTESRERVFTLARDADEQYLTQLRRYNEVKIRLEQAKVEVSALNDRLNIMLTAMKTNEDSS